MANIIIFLDDNIYLEVSYQIMDAFKKWTRLREGICPLTLIPGYREKQLEVKRLQHSRHLAKLPSAYDRFQIEWEKSIAIGQHLTFGHLTSEDYLDWFKVSPMPESDSDKDELCNYLIDKYNSCTLEEKMNFSYNDFISNPESNYGEMSLFCDVLDEFHEYEILEFICNEFESVPDEVGAFGEQERICDDYVGVCYNDSSNYLRLSRNVLSC